MLKAPARLSLRVSLASPQYTKQECLPQVAVGEIKGPNSLFHYQPFIFSHQLADHSERGLPAQQGFIQPGCEPRVPPADRSQFLTYLTRSLSTTNLHSQLRVPPVAERLGDPSGFLSEIVSNAEIGAVAALHICWGFTG